MYESVITVVAPTNTGPTVVVPPLALPDTSEPLFMEAWCSAFGGSNVHILRGNLQLTECQNRLAAGLADFLMTVSGASVCRRRLPNDLAGSSFTVFFEALNNSGQSQLVTVRITSDQS